MGLFFNHKCSVCRVRYPNGKMRPKGLGWICLECARDAGLAKRRGKR